MQTVKSWLESASKSLESAGIKTARLDSELIICAVLSITRTRLHAHPELILTKKQQSTLSKLLRKRSKSYPIAYILGKKEFYGRDFMVDESVLIPKPESEAFIEYIKKVAGPKKLNLVDVGTGSGCIGVTAKLEAPNLNVSLIDISRKALGVARVNAKNLGAEVTLVKSNLLKNYKKPIDIIVANLPYVDKTWDVSYETRFEPDLALYAKNNGLQIIESLISQSSARYLILESDPRQQVYIENVANEFGYHLVEKTNFVMLLESDSNIRTE